MKRVELFFTFILIPLDILMVVLAVVLAYKLRLDYSSLPSAYIEPFNEYLKFFIFTLPVWFVVFLINGLYSISERKNALNEFGKIVVAVSAVIALVVAYIFLSRTFFFSRLIVAELWALAILLVVIGRFMVRFIQRSLYKRKIGVHRVIILGHNSMTKPIVAELKKNYRLGYEIVKVIDKDGIEKLDTIVFNNPCDEIMVTDAGLPESQIAKVLEFCRLNGLVFKMTPNLFLVRSSHVLVQSLAGVPILEFQRTPLDGWGKIIKRSGDILGSLILIIILSPIMLLTAILVRLTSKGSILFHQERVGLGKNFVIYKFRTMRENAEEEHAKMMKKYGVMFKLKHDPRLTPIGSFLRKTSLDELPQFFNVLKGNMSLIGPRPPMPEEVAEYNNWQKKRLGVKPGITGLWQVSGRSELSFDDWVRLDAYYIENWSLWMDIQIFFKTIWVVLKGRGAY
ncbi:TPA: sugar transferase [Candidatus Berkelbacteria bacterium]|uniref:UDP-phosphate glucose phosphotransferase n=1 Tax=Berkelbacteria bacterium GW2011_GWE1_39_12 TaxID=1618337 RepID=A0A0G4B3W3_9BACT|nr:MAG: UDP-phosphate glucose phosphotransferase [Berkelbacteria bacterium GW2011_GWE1_39_12]HBO60257.1 sugar transferase [Candidatus Berkelbacteria bacterium]